MTPKQQTSARLDPELYARVKTLAAQEKRSYAAMLRILVEEALDARARSPR